MWIKDDCDFQRIKGLMKAQPLVISAIRVYIVNIAHAQTTIYIFVGCTRRGSAADSGMTNDFMLVEDGTSHVTWQTD